MLANPLKWPAARPRTKSRRASSFKVTAAQARKELYEELEQLGATKVVITTDAALRLDGQLAARQPWNHDPAVAVYFTRKGQEACIACDRWQDVGDNIRAIGLTLAGIRAAERWGTADVVDAMFAGFLLALPAGGESGWWSVLGVAPNADRSLIDAAYRVAIQRHHPDRGGSEDVFLAVQTAYQQACAVTTVSA